MLAQRGVGDKGGEVAAVPEVLEGLHLFAVLRRIALDPLRADTTKGSLKGKRKKAAWDDRYRARLLRR